MVNEQHIKAVFEVLRVSCKMPPEWSDRDTRHRAVQTWALVLADMSPEELMSAAVAYLRTPKAQWWPAPGSLLELSRPSDIDDADQAWGEVLIAMGQHGASRQPSLSTWRLSDKPGHERAIFRAVEAAGGWPVVSGGLGYDLFAGWCHAHVRAVSGDPDKSIRRFWDRLQVLAETHGADDPPLGPSEFAIDADPARGAAKLAGLQALGGWRRACIAPLDAEVANRASFRAAYRAVRRHRARESSSDSVRRLVAHTMRALPGGEG